MKNELFILDRNEPRHCIRCGAELVEVQEDAYMYPDFDEEGYSGSVVEYTCPKCGAHHSVTPVDPEDKDNYPAFNENLEKDFVDCGHGYDGECPLCGSHIVWSSDFMRSEVWGDTETFDENGEKIVDEFGCDVDDSLVTYVSCPHCGAYIEIVDAKPSEEKNYADNSVQQSE